MPRNAVIRRALGLGLVVASGAALIACSADPVTAAYNAGTNQGFVPGDGRVVEIPADQRGDAVSWAGITEHGDALASTDTLGDVTVVNFWYASCGPCRLEAPALEDVWQEHQDDGVSFVGVNTYDSAETAQAFAADYEVTYPSLITIDDPDVKLAFAKAAPITATPTTLVLDAQGRVAARIIGPVDGPSVLSTLVGDLLDEAA